MVTVCCFGQQQRRSKATQEITQEIEMRPFEDVTALKCDCYYTTLDMLLCSKYTTFYTLVIHSKDRSFTFVLIHYILFLPPRKMCSFRVL